MPTAKQAAQELQKLADKLDDLGDGMLEEAFRRLKANEIDKETYFAINNDVQKIYNQVASINEEILETLQGEVDASLEELEAVTKSLKESRRKLDKAENIARVCTKAVAAAALVASSIATPNAASIAGAVSAVAEIIRDIATI